MQNNSGLNGSSSAFDRYWQENNEIAKKENAKWKSDEKKRVAENRKKLASGSFKLVLWLLIFVSAAMFVMYRKAENRKTLEAVQAGMIGQTYSDLDSQIYFGGEEHERKIVTITDENMLKYTSGSYKAHVFKNSDGKWGSDWERVSVYDNELAYPYKLKISLLGKVTIEIDGETYKVSLKDDKTVEDIYFYSWHK